MLNDPSLFLRATGHIGNLKIYNMSTPKKTSPMLYVAITTGLLLIVTTMSVMNFPFNWVFYLTVIGQALIIVMVYKVLKDDYTTDKTFEHFYEDLPAVGMDKPVEPVEVRADNEDESLFR